MENFMEGIHQPPRTKAMAPSLTEREGGRIPNPLFILAPPRSFTSVVCAMLGQHPDMYGLPETSLFCAETMAEWLGMCDHAKFPMAHGLLRSVAQLVFGEQTEFNVREAWGWLRRRSHCTTGYAFELLAQRVAPRIVVDKSPSMVYRLESLRRTHAMFPNARYVHLTRHPRGYSESVMKHLMKDRENGAAPSWLMHLASWPGRAAAGEEQEPQLDPQHSWFDLHMRIIEFLSEIPPGQQIRVRGEDLLAPDAFREILNWLELDASDHALEEMKHPESWPYAMFGPANARFGTDRFFLARPELRTDRVEQLSLDGPISWLPEGGGFVANVRSLATEFGYR
jgi:hypothetical protein